MNTNLHSLLQQALEFYKNERYDESLKIFDDQLKIKEIDIESFKNKKCIIFNLKKYKHVLQYFDKILETNPTNPEILARKGFLERFIIFWVFQNPGKEIVNITMNGYIILDLLIK